MTTANPNRVALNIWVNLETRANLEYLANRHDSEFATEVRDAINFRAWLERQIEQGAILYMRMLEKEFFVLYPGDSTRRSFDRAQLIADNLRRTSP